jgi:hypothetical protein
MQSMRWNSNTGRLEPRTGKQFLLRIILAHLRGLTPSQFADEELARMRAERGQPSGTDPP